MCNQTSTSTDDVEIGRAIARPGAVLRLDYGAGHAHNALLHVRSIVDRYFVVVCEWCPRSCEWRYRLTTLHNLGLLHRDGVLHSDAYLQAALYGLVEWSLTFPVAEARSGVANDYLATLPTDEGHNV